MCKGGLEVKSEAVGHCPCVKNSICYRLFYSWAGQHMTILGRFLSPKPGAHKTSHFKEFFVRYHEHDEPLIPW